MTEANEIQRRLEYMRQQLTDEARNSRWGAKHNEVMVWAAFYASLFFGGLAVLGGLIKSPYIQPYMLSICAALGTGATFLQREGKYKAITEWHYAMSDLANAYLRRLECEMHIPVTRKDLEDFSKAWTRDRAELVKVIVRIKGSPLIAAPIESGREGGHAHSGPVRPPRINEGDEATELLGQPSALEELKVENSPETE